MPDVAKQCDEWRHNVLKDWTDHRLVSDLWLDLHIWWNMHLYADLANLELELTGWSVRELGDGVRMVIKVRKEEAPYVVFFHSKDTTGCLRKVREAMRNGGLQLVVDRYG